jgi:hypothetical protein
MTELWFNECGWIHLDLKPTRPSDDERVFHY